jgi:hypothetical protein
VHWQNLGPASPDRDESRICMRTLGKECGSLEGCATRSVRSRRDADEQGILNLHQDKMARKYFARERLFWERKWAGCVTCIPINSMVEVEMVGLAG